ncbi:MAG: hypothetical protein ACLTTH_16405 [Holdemanella porci]
MKMSVVHHDTKFMTFAGWNCCYKLGYRHISVRNFNNTISGNFILFRDFEPYFYAHGLNMSLLSKHTNLALECITAGDWLKDICINEYNMQADSFSFSYDKDLYTPKLRKIILSVFSFMHVQLHHVEILN